MPYERLTSLTSENRPREGWGISHGDVVQFLRAKPVDAPRKERMTEGIVRDSMTEKQDSYGRPYVTGMTDQYGRPIYHVEDEDGVSHYPLASDCHRVDPPVIPGE